MDQALEALSGIYVIADDVLVTGEGKTMEEAVLDHDRNLTALLERCKAKQIKLNNRLRATEARHMGHVLTAHGLKPDPGKVPARWKVLGMCKVLAEY